MKTQALFIDKDGTLIQNIPHNADPDRISFMPGVIRALSVLQRRYRIIVITNQSGIARGYFRIFDLYRVFRKIHADLKKYGVRLDGFYFCPHMPGTCVCRKPQPGLLRMAAKEHAIALRDSWMVGDILDDVEAGRRAGCRTILYAAGGEAELFHSPMRRPDFVAETMEDMVSMIAKERYLYGMG